MNSHARFLLLISGLLTAHLTTFGAAEAIPSTKPDDRLTTSYWESLMIAIQNGHLYSNPNRPDGLHEVPLDHRGIDEVAGVEALVGNDEEYPLSFDQRRNMPGSKTHSKTPHQIAYSQVQLSINTAHKHPLHLISPLIQKQLMIWDYLSQTNHDTTDINHLINLMEDHDNRNAIEHLKVVMVTRLNRAIQRVHRDKAISYNETNEIQSLGAILQSLNDKYPDEEEKEGAEALAIDGEAKADEKSDARLAARLQAMEEEGARHQRERDAREQEAYDARLAAELQRQENQAALDLAAKSSAHCAPGGPSWGPHENQGYLMQNQ